MPQNKTVSILTLGCAKNVSDTSNLSRVLKARGYQIVENAADAQTIVVHTCSFIEAAKKESIDTILQAGQLKKEGKQLFVTGCLVQQHGDEIFQELPEVDAFLGTGQLHQLPNLIEKPKARFIDRANPGGFMDPDAPLSDPSVSSTAYLRLSEGCSHPCSFCVIPRLRGPVQSRSKETILKEVRELSARGVEEIVIIGQDTGDWGRDEKMKPQLPQLLREIGNVKGIRWVRVMYMHPASFTDELISVFAEMPNKFPYLDMPFQHIDSRMLEEMRRLKDETYLRNLLTKIKKHLPALTLRTTFIVGHPGETEEQFKKLCSFTKEGFFDYLGAFAYSQEEGTPSAKRQDQLPDDLKKERLETLTQIYYDIAQSKAQKRLGTVETILIEDTEGDTVVGRTQREAPEIDAIIRLPAEAARHGRFITAKLTAYDSHEFTALPHTT